jgi:hypothetical protein
MLDVRGAVEVSGFNEYRYFVGGEWRSAESGRLFDVYRPYDRALNARVATMSARVEA